MSTPKDRTLIAMGDWTKRLIEALYYGANKRVEDVANELGWPMETVKQYIKVVDDRLEQRKVKLETILTEAQETMRKYDIEKSDLSTPEGWNSWCLEKNEKTKEQEMPEKKNELGDVVVAKDSANPVEEMKKDMQESIERAAAKAESDRLKKICFPIIRSLFSDFDVLVTGFNSYIDGTGVGQISITIQTAGL